jgi:hypothetical protein
MGTGRLQWIVCRLETRGVERDRVACPLRGAVPEAVCLACRYLMTSSLERTEVGWCEAPMEPAGVPLAPHRRSTRAPRPSPSSLRLAPPRRLDSAHADRIAR